MQCKMKRWAVLFLAMIMCVELTACDTNWQRINAADNYEVGNAGTVASSLEAEERDEDENTDTQPSDVSNIKGAADVPLMTLNNGVRVPQLGLGTQIQSLEQDTTAEGRQLLNQTSRDSVVAALKAGYRHLDTAHGYFNEEIYCKG